MCGIIGYVGENPQHQEKWITDGLEHLHHRGPDYENYAIGSNYAFGHARLSIIDLSSAGNQPMVYKNLTITFNGEIYNYKTLKSYAVNDDKDYHDSLGDTMTLLHCIDSAGINNALNQANGMWSFGLWDKQKQLFYASVDRFGQKPFYYYQQGNELWFSSYPNLLYKLKYGWDLDRQALNSYWHLGGIVGPDRLLRGIKKLCANELLTFNPATGKLTIENYWTPKTDAVTDISTFVYSAIDRVKTSDVPVNIFLSGGIDSSLVASRFKGSTAIHLKSPEIEYAQDVANKFNLQFKLADPTDHDIEDILDDYTIKCGEPTMAGAIPWITSKYAKQFGKVAVIANGADELFFGYNRIHGDDSDGSVQNMHMLRGSAFGQLNQYRKQYKGNPSSRWTELMTFVQFDINSTLDFASMCHSLEVRSPFLDHTLVEAALSIKELIHRKKGNKTLLKELLWQLGFTQSFTDRPKQGFSLHFKPSGLEEYKSMAMEWALSNKYLTLPRQISARDQSYLESSAIGLFNWFKHYSHHIYANQKN
jgi:asparagine synthase (glutamine-hydrolysing)